MNNIKTALCVVCAFIAATLSFTACSDKEEAGEYDNWKARNDQFLDSIAKVAKANADGKWVVCQSYTLGDDTGLYEDDPQNFIYMHYIEKSQNTQAPMYNDSVRVHYIGRLIPSDQHPAGYCFGKSSSTTTFNEETDVPTLLGVNGNNTGFITALLYLHEGDHVQLYIPYGLGYGVSEYISASIPAYSTLIYDLKLAKIYRFKIDGDTSWY